MSDATIVTEEDFQLASLRREERMSLIGGMIARLRALDASESYIVEHGRRLQAITDLDQLRAEIGRINERLLLIESVHDRLDIINMPDGLQNLIVAGLLAINELDELDAAVLAAHDGIHAYTENRQGVEILPRESLQGEWGLDLKVFDVV